jgi:hypothetical protein
MKRFSPDHLVRHALTSNITSAEVLLDIAVTQVICSSYQNQKATTSTAQELNLPVWVLIMQRQELLYVPLI